MPTPFGRTVVDDRQRPLFPPTPNSVNPDSFAKLLGTVPIKLFLLKINADSEERSPKFEGIVPEKELELKFNRDKALKSPRLDGIDFVSRFEFSESAVSVDNAPVEEGMVPVREL